MVMLIVLPGDDCIGGINTKYLKEYKKMNNNFDTFLSFRDKTRYALLVDPRIQLTTTAAR